MKDKFIISLKENGVQIFVPTWMIGIIILLTILWWIL